MRKGYEQAQADDLHFARLRGKIQRVYAQAENELTKKIEQFTKRYEEQDKIKRKQLAAGEITQQQYESWMRGQVFRGERWQSVKQAAVDQIYKANQSATGMMNGERKALFQESANYSAFQIEKGTHGAISFDLYDNASVTRLLKDDPKMLPDLKIGKRKDESWNGRGIQNAITQGIIQGESIPQIAKRISRETGERNRAAMTRQARTAMTGAQNAGRMAAMHDAKEMGIKVKKKWIATLDSKTRDTHAELDGQEVDEDQPFEVNGMQIMYPGDPNADPSLVYNCRCTLGWSYPDYPANGERRDNETGEIIGGTTYKEWVTGKQEQEDKTENIQVSSALDRVKEAIKDHKGAWSLDDIQKVGRDMKEEIENKSKPVIKEREEKKVLLKDQLAHESAESQKLANQLDDLTWKMIENAGKDDIEELKSKREALLVKLEEIENRKTNIRKQLLELDLKPDARVSALQNALKEIRSIGGITIDNVKEYADFSFYNYQVKKTREKTVEAMGFYPSQWLEKSKSYYKKLLPHWTTSRPYYSSTNGEIRFSDILGDNIHELAHRFEYTVPGILESERTFYEKRTKGEKLEWLGKGYRKDEMTRKDKFINKYMGKDYGGRSYELFSMGVQYAFTNYNALASDPDMESWLLGLLAYIP